MKLARAWRRLSTGLVLAALHIGNAEATTLTDNFNRANGGLGSNWTVAAGHDGTLEISNNQVRSGTETHGQSLFTITALGGNQYSQAQHVSGLAGGVINLVVRAREFNSSGTADMYRGQLNGLSGQWRIIRVDNSVETVLTSGALTHSNGDTFTFEAEGSSLTLKRNNVTIGTATDATYTVGDTGLGMYNHVDLLADNWQGGDITSSDSIAPSTPSGLSATGTSSSQISVSWNASTDNVGVSGYVLERCLGVSCTGFSQIATPAGTTYSDTGLAQASTYRYRVRASDAAGNTSGYSGVASASTQWSGAVITDDFNRANGDLGSNWTVAAGHDGTLGITGNQVQPPAGTYGESIYTANTFSDAQFSEVQLVSGLSGGVINLDVRARQYSNGSTADMYRGQLLGLDGVWRILRLDNGVETVLNSGALTSSNGDTFYFQAVGSTLTLKRNGTTLGSATDGTYGSGDAGLGIYNHVNLLVDNWRGGDVNTGDSQAPSVPTGLGGAVIASSQIDVSWAASTDNIAVTGYVLERCQGIGCSSWSLIATPSGTSYSDTGLSASTSYSYRVKALDGSNNASSFSSAASATTSSGGGGGGDSQVPTAPSSPSATAMSTSQINLSWTASTDNVGVTGYKVERCQGNGCSSWSQIATPSGTTYSDTGLTASTTYRYRIRANDLAGNNSGYSTIVEVTTQAGPDTQSPTTPSSLLIQPGTTTMGLSWTASTDNVAVTAYLIERCQGAGCSVFVEIGSTGSTTYVDTGLLGNVPYGYRVRARDAAGNFSNYSGNGSAVMGECD